jgi:hypothetical protein
VAGGVFGSPNHLMNWEILLRQATGARNAAGRRKPSLRFHFSFSIFNSPFPSSGGKRRNPMENGEWKIENGGDTARAGLVLASEKIAV